MATSELLNSEQVSIMLGLPKWTLGNYRPFLKDFPPAAAKQAQTLLYSLNDIERWAQGKDLKAIFSAACKARREQRKAAALAKTSESDSTLDNPLCKAIAMGAFLPPADRQALEFRKLVARTTQPKTTRIRLVHDWMQEDGRCANQRRTACNR